MANITTQTIRVDLNTGRVMPTAFTHQNDTARTLVFDMYLNGAPYTMTGNTVKFAYKSPVVDGQYSVIAGSGMASGTVSDNKVTVTLPSAYTAISGVGMLTMIITPTSGTVRPVNIRLVVQSSADGDNVVAGASDFPDKVNVAVDSWLTNKGVLIDLQNVKASTVKSVVGNEVDKTEQTGKFIRCVNGEWETIEISGFAVAEFPVDGGYTYKAVNALLYNPYGPLVMCLNANDDIIWSTEIPSGGSYEDEFQDVVFTAPMECVKVAINQHGSTAQLFEVSYTQHGQATSNLNETVSDLMRYACDSTSTFDSETISITANQYKYINGAGKVLDVGTSYPSYYVSDFIEVEPTKAYKITASANYSHGVYAFYDINHEFISSLKASSSASGTQLENEIVVIPDDCIYILLSTINGSDSMSITNIIPLGGSKKWNGKKWSCVGDSLTAVNTRATKRYHDYIADETGISVVNLGIGGTGYMKPYDGGLPFYQRIDDIPLDSNVITIFGSGNDLSLTLGSVTDTGTDTICGCINNTIDGIRSRIIGANIGIITPTPWQGYPTETVGNAMDLYSNAIIEICKRKGVPCLDLYHCSNMTPWVQSFRNEYYSRDDGNGVHPDENGHKLIAPRFKGFLETLLM